MDTYRSVAVHLGTSDLKSMMKANLKAKGNIPVTNDVGPGEPNDVMYLKQAEHLMKRGTFAPAVMYLEQALMMNPASKVRAIFFIHVEFVCSFRFTQTLQLQPTLKAENHVCLKKYTLSLCLNSNVLHYTWEVHSNCSEF